MLTASADGTAKLWNASGYLLQTFIGHTDLVVSAVFSRDGGLVLTASDDKTAKVWNADTGDCIKTLRADNVQSALFACGDYGRRFGAYCLDERPQSLWF